MRGDVAGLRGLHLDVPGIQDEKGPAGEMSTAVTCQPRSASQTGELSVLNMRERGNDRAPDRACLQLVHVVARMRERPGGRLPAVATWHRDCPPGRRRDPRTAGDAGTVSAAGPSRIGWLTAVGTAAVPTKARVPGSPVQPI